MNLGMIYLTASLAFVPVSPSTRPESDPGNIEAESVLLRIIDRVDIPARAPGVLQKVLVVEGQSIEAGATLAQVDETDAALLQEKAKAELELATMEAKNEIPIRAAEAALRFAREELNRLEMANKAIAQSISRSKLAEAQEKVELRQLSLNEEKHKQTLAAVMRRLKESDLRLSTRSVDLHAIVAAQSGTITQIYKRHGEWVKPGENVVQIVRVDRLRAEGFVPAQQVAGDLVGASVTVTAQLPNRGALTFPGKIVFVHPEIDPVNGQMRVWAEVDNANQTLRPGMHAQMTIVPRHVTPPVTTHRPR